MPNKRHWHAFPGLKRNGCETLQGHHHRMGQVSSSLTPRVTRLCQARANVASSRAPMPTGTIRKLQDMLLTTTTSGSMPAVGETCRSDALRPLPNQRRRRRPTAQGRTTSKPAVQRAWRQDDRRQGREVAPLQPLVSPILLRSTSRMESRRAEMPSQWRTLPCSRWQLRPRPLRRGWQVVEVGRASQACGVVDSVAWAGDVVAPL